MFSLRRAPVTAALLAIITLIFVVEMLLGGNRMGSGAHFFMGDIDGAVLFAMGAIIPDALKDHNQWRLLTAIFLHANFLHWLANAWSLFQLGTAYEVMFGSKRLIVVYFVTGIVASIASAMHLAAPDGLAVGASGAILGVLGAFIFSIRRSHWRHERWTRSLLNQLVFWGIVNVTLPLYVKEIDNWAHIAGVLSGLLLGLIIPQRAMPPRPPAQAVIDVQPRDPNVL